MWRMRKVLSSFELQLTRISSKSAMLILNGTGRPAAFTCTCRFAGAADIYVHVLDLSKDSTGLDTKSTY